MSNLPEVYLLQATRKHLELAKSFQDEMGTHFFERTMFDVKDALTSILALCDMEDMKQLAQVKKYIQRVVDLLQDVRLYQSSSLFNVNHVVINVINVMKERYKSKISIKDELHFIKASVKSDKSHLEQLLLYSLIEGVESGGGKLDLKIELAQKERDAIITLRLENFKYLPIALKEIRDFHNPSAFRMQINEQNNHTEMVIRLPLFFETREKEAGARAAGIVLTLGELKATEKQHPRARFAQSEHKIGQHTERDLVYGAQERT